MNGSSPAAAVNAGPTPAVSSGTAVSRLIGAAVCFSTLALLLTAYLLSPDPRGVGTHEQLGLAPCGFKLATGLPCVTCGMTTSFSHAAHGDLLSAFATQPGGAMLAVAVAAACLIGLWAMLSGMSLAPLGRLLGRPKVIISIAVTLLLAWSYTLVETII